MILGEEHLHAVLTGYQVHYNTARPHQGIAQRVPDGRHDAGHLTAADLDRSRILRKPALGGLINEYARAARYSEEGQVTTRILFSSGTSSLPSANNRTSSVITPETLTAVGRPPWPSWYR